MTKAELIDKIAAKAKISKKAANVALNVKSFGAVPILCSVIGGDERGTIFLDLLEEQNLSDVGITVDEYRLTTQKTRIDEELIPVKESVKGLCEMFGFDPLFMANEGKVVMVVSDQDAQNVIEIMRKDENGTECSIIGELTKENLGKVILKTEIGGKRIVDMPAGEQLPRIC